MKMANDGAEIHVIESIVQFDQDLERIEGG